MILFTTSADRGWSNLPAHGFFTMLLQQAVTSLTSSPNAGQISVGQPAELVLTGRQVGDRVQLNSADADFTDLIDLSQRFNRFDLVDGRALGLGTFDGGGQLGNAGGLGGIRGGLGWY